MQRKPTKLRLLLATARVRCNMTQREQAKLLGVSAPFLSAIERGTKNVNTRFIDKLIEQKDNLDEAVENILFSCYYDILTRKFPFATEVDVSAMARILVNIKLGRPTDEHLPTN